MQSESCWYEITTALFLFFSLDHDTSSFLMEAFSFFFSLLVDQASVSFATPNVSHDSSFLIFPFVIILMLRCYRGNSLCILQLCRQ